MIKYNIAICTSTEANEDKKLFSCHWEFEECVGNFTALSFGIRVFDYVNKVEVAKWDLWAIFEQLGINYEGIRDSTSKITGYDLRVDWIRQNIFEASICDSYIIEGYTGLRLGEFSWDKTPWAQELLEIVAFPVL